MKGFIKRQKKIEGFTLIELMLTIAVSSVVISLATPSFTEMIKSSKQTAVVNSFVGDYSFARSEAVKSGEQVTMCKFEILVPGVIPNVVDVLNTAGGSCQSGAGKVWENGWVVFIDIDGDAILEIGDGDKLLRSHEELGGSLEIFSSKNRITISPVGFTRGYNTTFKFCDDRGPTNARGRVLEQTGRLRQHNANVEAALTCV